MTCITAHAGTRSKHIGVNDTPQGRK